MLVVSFWLSVPARLGISAQLEDVVLGMLIFI